MCLSSLEVDMSCAEQGRRPGPIVAWKVFRRLLRGREGRREELFLGPYYTAEQSSVAGHYLEDRWYSANGERRAAQLHRPLVVWGQTPFYLLGFHSFATLKDAASWQDRLNSPYLKAGMADAPMVVRKVEIASVTGIGCQSDADSRSPLVAYVSDYMRILPKARRKSCV